MLKSRAKFLGFTGVIDIFNFRITAPKRNTGCDVLYLETKSRSLQQADQEAEMQRKFHRPLQH